MPPGGASAIFWARLVQPGANESVGGQRKSPQVHAEGSRTGTIPASRRLSSCSRLRSQVKAKNDGRQLTSVLRVGLRQEHLKSLISHLFGRAESIGSSKTDIRLMEPSQCPGFFPRQAWCRHERTLHPKHIPANPAVVSVSKMHAHRLSQDGKPYFDRSKAVRPSIHQFSWLPEGCFANTRSLCCYPRSKPAWTASEFDRLVISVGFHRESRSCQRQGRSRNLQGTTFSTSSRHTGSFRPRG